MSQNCIRAFVAGALVFIPVMAGAATITVNTLVDENINNANCSLREAMASANADFASNGCVAGAGSDRIRFEVNGTILLTADLPVLTQGLTIDGPGAINLTIDGDEQYRMFRLDNETSATEYMLKELTLTDGSSAASEYSAALFVGGNVHAVVEDTVITGMTKTVPGGGGAINGTTSASLTVRRSTFSDNSTSDGPGGAIQVSSTFTVVVEDSLFAGNHINGATRDGGAIAVAAGGSATLRRSTFSGNSSNDDGGGALAMYASTATLTIESCTFTGNSAAGTGGAFMLNAGTATISNSIFADNQISGTPAGNPTSNISQTGSATLTTLGYNFIGDNEGAVATFPAGNPNANNDIVGTFAAPIDPMLSALVDNGGPTLTHRVQVGSPLIDKGSCTGEPHDQRIYGNGVDGRIVNAAPANADDGCDIGAYERLAVDLLPLFLDGFETPDS